MRGGNRWPLVLGLVAGGVILLVAGVSGSGELVGWAPGDRLFGVDAAGWAVALLATVLALAIQIVHDDQAALERERRLVHAAVALREATARLELQATTDVLTGLANRRAFYERLGSEHRRALRYGRPLAAIMVDLDHFKRVNDEHGHAFGDLVLSVAAQTLRSNVRESDQVARYGGEEFVLMLPETGGREAMVVAEKLRAAIAAQDFTDGITWLRLTASFGVAALPECLAADGDQLVRLADQALYETKGAGRDRVILMQPPSPQATR